MISLLPTPPAEISDPLQHVLQRAVEGGAEPPPWVAVEDDEQRWVAELASRSPGERARLVAALRTDEAMVTAARLGVGGAIRLPPSTPDATAALEAAADPAPLWIPDSGLADLAGDPAHPPLAVGWLNRPFWRCQLGERVMAERLSQLACELGVRPAVGAWPVLVVAERSREDIADAWARLTRRLRVTSEGLVVARCSPLEPHCGLAAAAVRALVHEEVDTEADLPVDLPPEPVYELPSGRHVGWWGPSVPDEVPGQGWFAAPVAAVEHGYRWHLQDGDDTRRVDDVLLPAETGATAFRLPGWVAVDLAPGRPTALILDRLAAAAARSGHPLWVPNVDAAALKLLLGKPGPFWVDGPAAPRADDR